MMFSRALVQHTYPRDAEALYGTMALQHLHDAVALHDDTHEHDALFIAALHGVAAPPPPPPPPPPAPAAVSASVAAEQRRVEFASVFAACQRDLLLEGRRGNGAHAYSGWLMRGGIGLDAEQRVQAAHLAAFYNAIERWLRLLPAPAAPLVDAMRGAADYFSVLETRVSCGRHSMVQRVLATNDARIALQPQHTRTLLHALWCVCNVSSFIKRALCAARDPVFGSDTEQDADDDDDNAAWLGDGRSAATVDSVYVQFVRARCRVRDAFASATTAVER